MTSVVRLATAEAPMCVPALGIGCWSWGDDKGVWGWQSYDKSLTRDSISSAFRSAMQGGVRLFDTAETYGSGLSEEIVASQLKSHGAGDVMIATKFQPGKWSNQKVRPAMLQAAKESCERLGVNQIDLYQIHAPLHPDSFTEQGHALADVVEAGLARAVGVSNFSLEQMTEVHAALEERGIPLATNQVEYSLLRQYPDSSGLKAGCDRLGVKILAYSPLGMGRLTGKYSAKVEPQGRRGFAKMPMREVEPLLAKLREVGAKHECTPGQVALAWVMAQGAIPIPGAKNAQQAEENAGAMRVQLSPEEVQALSKLGAQGGTSRWQHG